MYIIEDMEINKMEKQTTILPVYKLIVKVPVGSFEDAPMDAYFLDVTKAHELGEKWIADGRVRDFRVVAVECEDARYCSIDRKWISKADS